MIYPLILSSIGLISTVYTICACSTNSIQLEPEPWEISSIASDTSTFRETVFEENKRIFRNFSFLANEGCPDPDPAEKWDMLQYLWETDSHTNMFVFTFRADQLKKDSIYSAKRDWGYLIHKMHYSQFTRDGYKCISYQIDGDVKILSISSDTIIAKLNITKLISHTRDTINQIPRQLRDTVTFTHFR